LYKTGENFDFKVASEVSQETCIMNELRDFYLSPSIITMIKSRRKRWEGYVVRMGEKRNKCRILGKPEGKRPLGRPRCRWVVILRWILKSWDVGW
jgi:hypothetical protein